MHVHLCLHRLAHVVSYLNKDGRHAPHLCIALPIYCSSTYSKTISGRHALAFVQAPQTGAVQKGHFDVGGRALTWHGGVSRMKGPLPGLAMESFRIVRFRVPAAV